jgi:hypothetical protein
VTLAPIPSRRTPPSRAAPTVPAIGHVLVVDDENCVLYELFDAHPNADGSWWYAGSGAVFDLHDHALRPEGWTSADAAGLPILPGLVRYDEVASGQITHAIRFTAPQTQRAYVWPARHFASSLTGGDYPPMGQRFRLKANVDISGFSPSIQVILRAMQRYGIILADNGSAWFISGVPDERWDNDELHELHNLQGADFEAVHVSSLMIDPDSGQVLMQLPEPDYDADGDVDGIDLAEHTARLQTGATVSTTGALVAAFGAIAVDRHPQFE